MNKFLNPPAEKKCSAWQKKLQSVVDKLGSAHKTAADGLGDFVSTMMHEVSHMLSDKYNLCTDSTPFVQLTHTKAGGQTNDTGKKGLVGFIQGEFFNKDSYGWSNCVGLKSATNADS